MERKTKRLYEFGPFRMDPDESLLLRDGSPVYLKPKVFETLLLLVENRGRVLDRETLMQSLWQDTFVEEANLTVNISQLRKTLSQAPNGDQFIETVPRRGYRFAAKVREVITEEAALVVREYTTSRITVEEEVSDRFGDIEGTETNAAPLSTSQSTKQFPLIDRILRKKRAAIGIGLILVVTALAVVLVIEANRSNSPRFQRITLRDLPNTGQSLRAAISPDGKYVAHSTMQDGKQSLWMKQVSTGSDIELVPPDGSMYYGLAFSIDGDYVLFVRSEYPIVDNPEASIFKVPALGGPSVRLVSNVDTDLAVSPDGKRIAFTRTDESESKLILANEDGTGERILATRQMPARFRNLAWSPNGDIIACTAPSGDMGATAFEVCGVSVGDGANQPIGSLRSGIPHGIKWVSDEGLLLAAPEKFGRSQIWHVSYPDGFARNITNDLNDYLTVSVTSDSRLILTNLNKPSIDLWIAKDDDWANVDQITTGATDFANARWTPDGRIVAQSSAGGSANIWEMQADGTRQKQLTANRAPDGSPVVSPDGRHIAFESLRSGTENIWRMDRNGDNVIQLTTGKRDKGPQFSPNGNWVVYTSYAAAQPTLWRVPVNGGEAVQVTDRYSVMPDVSPDGKWIACLYKDKVSSPTLTMAIVPFDGGKPKKVFDPPANGVSVVRWTKDGRALSFSANRDGAHEVWIQPVDGGAARPLTQFKTAQIQSFDWSPDGHKLVCVRNVVRCRVVLIGDSANE